MSFTRQLTISVAVPTDKTVVVPIEPIDTPGLVGLRLVFALQATARLDFYLFASAEYARLPAGKAYQQWNGSALGQAVTVPAGLWYLLVANRGAAPVALAGTVSVETVVR